MTYNMDFLVASLMFLLIVLLHLMNQKEFKDNSSRIFSIYMFVGVADIFLDMVSSFLVERNTEQLNGITEITMTLFYLMQTLVIYFVLYYAKSQEKKNYELKKKEIIAFSIPVAGMSVFILLNHFTRFFFYFDPDGTYHKGSGYLLMYGFALVYVVILVINIAVNRKFLENSKRRIILELLLIMSGCVGIQAVGNGILTTGLGVGLGIVLLALTINNPHEYIDHLTGAYNSAYFNTICSEMIERRRKFYVLVISLKNMKQINAAYGIKVGDQYLLAFGKILTENSSQRSVYRMNGSRFAVVSESVDEFDKTLGKIVQQFESSIRIGDMDIPSRIHLCSVPNAYEFESADKLWSYCNYLSSIAIDHNKSVYTQSTKELIDQFKYEEQIEQFLNEAIEKDYFEMYFQPVFSPEKRKYVSAEALSRLTHPALGPVRPDLFIRIAERNGMISEITRLQFERLCRFIHDNPVLIRELDNIKFNFSPADLLKKGTVADALQLMEQYGIPNSFIQIEITETVATEYCENVQIAIEKFEKAGIRIVLDDFGSGFANMNTVLKLPFVCIKMDRSLLDGIGTDENAAVFYQNMVSTFRNMGYAIVAEGVSTEEESKLVSAWGVDMIQGFYYSKPLPRTELLQLLNVPEGQPQGGSLSEAR